MSYRITATSAMGTLQLTRADPAAALKKARELEAQAYMDVRIVDPEGTVRDADGFAAAIGGHAPDGPPERDA
ncbi:MAG: hypothetical protein AB7O45_11440 [Alphaproteobacteria bacterium]